MAEGFVREKIGRGEMLRRILHDSAKALPPSEVPRETVVGGRGGDILEHFSPQPRSEPSQEQRPPTIQTQSLGRGALINMARQSMLASSVPPTMISRDDASKTAEVAAAATVLATATTTTAHTISTPNIATQHAVIGRGRGHLAQMIAERERQMLTASPSSPPSSPAVVQSQFPSSPALGCSLPESKQITHASNGPTSNGPASNGPASRSQRTSEHRLPIRELKELSVNGKTSQPPPVMEHGDAGRKIPVTANYIRLDLEPGRAIYEYEVKFEPVIDNIRFRHSLVSRHKDMLGEYRIFDGSILYLPFRLENDRTTVRSINEADKSEILITIIFKKKDSMGTKIHLYNVLFNRIMNMLSLARLGRQFCDPRSATQIPQHRLEVWPGYVTAVDEYEGGIHLCCDTSHRVLRTQTVLDVIEDLKRHTSHGKNWQERVKQHLIGTSVLTRYRNAVYRIDDIDFTKTPLSKFMYRSDQEVTFKDYFYRQYQIELQDLEQPILITRGKNKLLRHDEKEVLLCLIPEICYMTGLTDDMRSDFGVMKDLSRVMIVNPNQRQYALKQFIENIKGNREALELLSGWGLHLPNKTVDLIARVIDKETIFFGNGATVKPTDADWSRAATNNHMLTTVDLLRWAVIHTQRDSRCSKEFVSTLCRVAPQMGVKVSQPDILPLPNDSIDNYIRVLREYVHDRVQLVVIIFPSARSDKYSAVKKICCIEKPVASQVIIARTISRQEKLRAIVQKIALQINCKLGGTLWSVRVPINKVMICGIDSYHDPRNKNNSVAGFVASVNNDVTRWFSKVSIQRAKQEFVDGLKVCLLSAVEKFRSINGCYPDPIIIYRDGVGDGQLSVCAEHEVPQLQNCLRSVSPDYKPQMAFIVTQKRINTKIYSVSNTENYDNVPPGTVLDNTVTRRNWYDFFLVSQNVRQGTASPTHYIVVQNSTRFNPDKIQHLTYKMSHLYYNWPGTIRVPAACQYAHKLAYLVGENLFREPSPFLSDKLFYL